MRYVLESFETPAPGGADRKLTKWRLMVEDTGEIMECDSATVLAGVLVDRTMASEVGGRDDVLPAIRREIETQVSQLAAVLAARSVR